MRVRDDGWLEETLEGAPAVRRVPSVRTSLMASTGPAGLVWHWTGGRCGPLFAQNLAEGIKAYDRSKDSPASWHLLIAKSGQVFQSVPTNAGAWHVGRAGRIGGMPVKTGGEWSAALFPDGKLYANVNSATIGVELENAGRLRQVGQRFYCWPYWLNPEAPAEHRVPSPKLEVGAERAMPVNGAFFDVFPEEQQAAALRVLLALVVRYRWGREVCQYGHFMFDAARKEDPGPLWMEHVLPKLLNAAFGTA